MVPSFFGSSERPLFGIYHPPRARPRDTGVLLCYPAPQEYLRAHWAFRQLATRLTQQGFHVFRFDYDATGDSAGDSADACLETWRDNVATAARELRDVASVTKLAAVGYRLGATLAATARVALADLVLWEPVVRGDAYVDELRAAQARELADDLAPPWSIGEAARELLGFPLTQAHEDELRAIDLVHAEPARAARTAIMVSSERPLYRELAASLSRHGGAPVYRYVPEVSAPSDSRDLGSAMLARDMIEAITTHLAGASHA